MNKIKVGSTEIEVVALRAYAYVNGKSEKFLKIDVSADVADFEALRTLLENTTENIQYFEDDVLVCEYVGYGKFEMQYKDGTYTVEMHKDGIVEQMSALLTANETLAMAINALDEANAKASVTIAMLEEQNAMLEMCILEMSEKVYA